jgi:hypothetical protein
LSLDCQKIFGLPFLPLWKKEAKRRHETSTVNQQLLSLSCVVLAARRGETLFIVKGFGERKGAELFLLC